MLGEPRRGKPRFKDYCLILQVHPEADAAMIDAAYWHLAKRCNEASPDDSRTRLRMEELNEAYNVLGSPDRRDEYLKVRAQVLGMNALPVPPPPDREKPPLTIMERQRPRATDRAAHVESARGRRATSAISRALALTFVLALAVAAFLGGTSTVIVAGLVVVGLLSTAALLASAISKRHPALPSIRVRAPRRKPSAHLPRRRAPEKVTPIDIASVQSATRSRTEVLRRHVASQSSPRADQPRGQGDAK